MRTTLFRALRNFYLSGHGDCRIGELLELDDNQARELVALGDTVEPVSAKDRRRVVIGRGRVEWEAPKETPPERVRLVGAIGGTDRWPPTAA